MRNIYEKLYKYYGKLDWWQAKSSYEVMVGAVLAQNTTWSNVQKAIKNFGEELSPRFIEDITMADLEKIIKPAGFFARKASYLKELTKWYNKYNYSEETIKNQNLESLRNELLSVRGIGPETADSILLYAFSIPTFVVDTYTKRLLTRLNIDVKIDYNSIKTLFEDELPIDVDLYKNYHGLIVENAKLFCKAKPLCQGCPLSDICFNEKGTIYENFN